MGQASKPPAAAALAAFEMCESLIITLVEKGVLTRDEVSETLEAVIAAKRELAEEHESKDDAQAATLVTDIARSVAAAKEPRRRGFE
jgi:polyhydroxyalkanoate synthesis regulator phasin